MRHPPVVTRPEHRLPASNAPKPRVPWPVAPIIGMHNLDRSDCGPNSATAMCRCADGSLSSTYSTKGPPTSCIGVPGRGACACITWAARLFNRLCAGWAFIPVTMSSGSPKRVNPTV